MKILITGIAGFIGYHTSLRALKDGHQVVGVDNLNDYYDIGLKQSRLGELGVSLAHEKNIRFDEKKSNMRCDGSFGSNKYDNLTFYKADITDFEKLSELFSAYDFDLVCHLAAQAGVRYSIENPRQYIDSNIIGFFNVLECCRHSNVKKLVFASSSSVYGKNSDVPYTEEQRADSPVSLYAATKKSNELMAHSYSELFGLNAVGLRYFTVYGPWGRPDMAPFLFTEAILNGRPIKIFNGGDMMRDFSYVDDIADGTYAVLTGEPSHDTSRFNIYNIGNSSPVHLGQFIETIERVTGREAVKNYLPMQQGDVTRTWADTTHIAQDYGFSKSTDLEDGLKNFVKWYKEYYKS